MKQLSQIGNACHNRAGGGRACCNIRRTDQQNHRHQNRHHDINHRIYEGEKSHYRKLGCNNGGIGLAESDFHVHFTDTGLDNADP